MQVWQAVVKRPVALKVLAPQLAEDPVFRERFIEESRAAAVRVPILEHPWLEKLKQLILGPLTAVIAAIMPCLRYRSAPSSEPPVLSCCLRPASSLYPDLR